MEIFRDIEGYEGLYQVSNLGRVKSLEHIKGGKCGSIRPVRERILKTGKRSGYPSISLCKNGKKKSLHIHRLVAQAFIPNPDNLPEVNHKDEDKTNNSVTNLEWCTYQYNNNYGTVKERQIKSHIGLYNNPKQSKPVVCIETGIIYQSMMEIQRQLGYNTGKICECCKGKRKTAYRFHWQYVIN